MTEKKTLSLKGTLGLKKPLSSTHAGVQVQVRKKRGIDAKQTTTPTMDAEKAEKIKLLQQAIRDNEAKKKALSEQNIQSKFVVVEAEKPIPEKPVEVPVEEKKPLKQTTPVNKPHSAKESKSNSDNESETFKENKKSKGFEDKKQAKIRVSEYQGASDDDDEFIQHRRRSLASIRRAREKAYLKHQESLKTAEKISREITLPELITVQELANRMSERSATVVKTLMNLGVMATITQTIDADTAELVATELGHRVIRVSESDVEDSIKSAEDSETDKESRPPVVTVMGHVDHGKTSLLDALRSTNVAGGESGGITQHIGAYQITTPQGKKITFIDTPGHAAFSQMRSRGASITDIVVLVVAANDSVMPQTIEAISHAQNAGVPIIVAINKIDVQGANPDRVRTDLLQHGVIVEKMGGDVLDVEVSAKNKTNLDKLLEAILLQAEILDLKANPNRLAEGVVIEAKMEKGRGPVATLLVSRGTLKIGDNFVVGNEYGRVRVLLNDHHQAEKIALPAQPIEVIGLQGVPSAGDKLVVVDDEAKAKEISAYRSRKAREALTVKSAKSGTAMDQLMDKIKAGEVKEFPVIIKADVQGSIEALIGVLSKIKNDEVGIKVVHSGVGGINESDVALANTSGASIIGFNVRAGSGAREAAKRDGVDIKYYSIIYTVADDMKQAVEGLLKPQETEAIIGTAEIRQIFSISKVGNIAGCMVIDGEVKRGCGVRLIRDDVVIHTGDLAQLKREKNDAKEVKAGFECGILLEKYNDIKIGDKIECFEIRQVASHLDIKG